MDEEKKETSVKFQSKSEIAKAIEVLTPFALCQTDYQGRFDFALKKIAELTKLL